MGVRQRVEVSTVGIILKYLAKSISEKKMRTFLITLAIVLSSAVFFASLAISGSLMEMFTGLIRGFYGNGLFPFEGRKVVISRQVAQKYKLGIGDTVTFELGEGKFRFRICGLASPTGFFKGDKETAFIVVPKDTLGSIANARGKANTIYAKLKNPAEKQEMIKLLSEAYKNYRVEEPCPFDTLKQQTAEVTAVFMMLSCVVFFMSVFIIYSSFKVITAERLPVIGTFRSIGATGALPICCFWAKVWHTVRSAVCWAAVWESESYI